MLYKKKFGLTKFCSVWQNFEFCQTNVWQNFEYFDSTDLVFYILDYDSSSSLHTYNMHTPA